MKNRIPVAALLLLLLAALPPAWAASPDPKALGEKARQLLAGPRFQKDVPLARGGTAGRTGSERRTGGSPESRGAGEVGGGSSDGASGMGDESFWGQLVKRLQRAEEEKPESGGGGADRSGDRGQPPAVDAPRLTRPELPGLPSPAPGAAAPLLRVLLAMFLAVLLVLLAVGFVGRRRRRSSSPPVAAFGAESGPGPDEAPPTTDEASRLAGHGLYGEAVHLLLLLAIERLFARSRSGPPPAETGRELVRRLSSHGDARPAFAGLVAASERFHFAGAPLGREDYEAGLADFQRAVSGTPT